MRNTSEVSATLNASVSVCHVPSEICCRSLYLSRFISHLVSGADFIHSFHLVINSPLLKFILPNDSRIQLFLIKHSFHKICKFTLYHYNLVIKCKNFSLNKLYINLPNVFIIIIRQDYIHRRRIYYHLHRCNVYDISHTVS